MKLEKITERVDESVWGREKGEVRGSGQMVLRVSAERWG